VSSVPVGLKNDPSSGSVVLPSGERVPYLLWREPGIELLKWHLYLIRLGESQFPIARAPWWSDVQTRQSYNPPGAPFFVNVRVELAAGWPLRCMRWCYKVQDPPGTKFFEPDWCAHRLSDHTAPPTWSIARTRALPLIPVWRGLAVDSLAYGAAFAAIGLALTTVRRSWRRSRGRCTRCGYARAGLEAGAACPECGTRSLA